jgi:16S rRNA U516 pseudouridylate synthase RsuA-like enzyme
MEAKHQHYLALAKNHVRFTSDVRALHYTLNAYTANGRNHVINEVTNADGKFVVRLKRQKYFVYAIDSRKLPTGTEEYRWLFEYTPDGSVLKLTNDNMN